MRVYTISRIDMGGGYSTPEIDSIKTEFEVELQEYGEDAENHFTKENISKAIDSISRLEVLGIDEGGMGSVRFGPFIITAGEMTQGEYESLEEFSGW